MYIISQEIISDQSVVASFFTISVAQGENEILSSKIVTKSAKKLMDANHLNENDFAEEVITEEIINAFLKGKNKVIPVILEGSNFKHVKKVALIGAGQGLAQVLDLLFNLPEFVPVQIYDDTPEKQGTFFFNIPLKGVVDSKAIIKDFKNGEFDFIVNTVSTSITFRKKIFTELSNAGIPFANLIHPASYIGFNNIIGQGNVVFAHVSIGPCTQIGNDNFISARCNIEHHNVLGNHCTFGPGVMTSGSVTIGNEVKFGTGVFIEPKLVIGSNSIIASGSIVTRNIDEEVVAYPHGSKLTFKKLKS